MESVFLKGLQTWHKKVEEKLNVIREEKKEIKKGINYKEILQKRFEEQEELRNMIERQIEKELKRLQKILNG